YRCGPADGSKPHTFTPPLPRAHVHAGESCRECLELRGFHRGERSVARRHRLPARVVARGLSDAALGLSYAKTGLGALTAAGLPTRPGRRRPPAKPPRPRRRWSTRKRKRRSPASKNMGRFWQIGAGLVEAFAPVVWAPVEARLRQRAASMREAGQPLVWILDELPIYGRDAAGNAKKSGGYAILVLAELDWTDPAVPGATKLRLVRAMPALNGTAWRLAFAEMGYVPDMILSDASTSIISGVSRHFGTPGPLFVPSIWHIGQALENNALEDALRGPYRDAFRAHLAQLARDGKAMESVAAWHTWWDTLGALAIQSRAVRLDDLRRSRANYEDRMAAALPALLADPRLGMSTGGIESLNHTWIDPLLAQRQYQFANIERTNNLFDLAVCRSEGAFTDLNAVAALIEADELPWGGWTVPLRAIADPQPRRGTYSSLRDEALMNAIAEERGLL
ncbi:MAG: hypothetical protein M0Z49_10520, partial [Chloroflexi bacterium]|nr:hypothetical protein [Chloroflexota bacterium]